MTHFRVATFTMCIAALVSASAAAADPPGSSGKSLSRLDRIKLWAAPVRVIQTDKNLSLVHYGLKDGRRVVKSVETQRADGTRVSVVKGAHVGPGLWFPTVSVSKVKPDGSGELRSSVRGWPELGDRQQLAGQTYSRLTPAKARTKAFFSSPIVVGAAVALPAGLLTLGTGAVPAALRITAGLSAAMAWGTVKLQPNETRLTIIPLDAMKVSSTMRRAASPD